MLLHGYGEAGVLDDLKIDRAGLVTHTIANMVGYAFAAQYPERVRVRADLCTIAECPTPSQMRIVSHGFPNPYTQKPRLWWIGSALCSAA